MVTIDSYPIDIVETEEHKLVAEVTDHPVEDGSDISDNIRLKPRELTFTNAVVSNTPIGAIADDDTRVLGDTLPPISMDAYRRLEQIWLTKKIVEVVTNLKKYDSMVLDDLTIVREAKSAGGLIFTAHFKEVRVVKNKRVTVAIPNTGGEQNLGLSLDNIIQGKKILWRKGKPPGLSGGTTPPGIIYGQEIVTVEDRGSKPANFLHPSGKALNTQELQDFAKDLQRDTGLMTDRGLFLANQKLDQIGTTIIRGNNLAEYKLAHPGQNPEPSLFGLKAAPNGGLTAI